MPLDRRHRAPSSGDTGCSDETRGSGVSIAGASEELPCDLHGYPYTWNEVAPEIVTRTKHIGEIAALLSVTTPSLDSIAAFVAEQTGVAEVVIDGTGVRYRLDGGRPGWVFLPSEMDHHRAPATQASRPSGSALALIKQQL